LKFGKVGRFHLSIPLFSLFSQAIRVEISDIFMIVEPKDIDEWKKEIELEAFRLGV